MVMLLRQRECRADAFQNVFIRTCRCIVLTKALSRECLSNYTTADALNKMAVPGADEAEKRKKFEGV